MRGMDWETKKKKDIEMEFISCEDRPIREPISWPNMCAWCLSVPTVTYIVRGGGFLRTPWSRSRIKVECPICREHYFWLRGIEISFFVILGGWGLYGIICELFSLTGLAFSEWIYLPLLLAPLLIRYLIEPVRISEEGGWYSIMIRNERYATEFAHLNNLELPSKPGQ